MSKKKKTIGELLEEALVPEDEQPFQVPENWVWVRTETANGIVTGSTPAKKQSEYYGGGFPFVKPADLEQGSEVIHASEYLTEKGKAVSRIIPKESTMVCCIGSIGKAGFSTVECTTNQQINSLVPNKKMINPKFNYYQVLNGTYQNELWNRSSATTVSIINKGKMSLIPYVLPPFNEQKRIAEKVERLLSKIEEAKQLIEEAKDTFELRRAAILDKAFRGELTRKWREENSLEKKEVELINGNQSIESNSPYSIPTTWKWRKLKDVASFKNGFAFKSKDFVEQGIQLVRMGNLYKNDLALDRNPVYMPLDFDEKIIEKYSVKNGDILLSLTGTKYKRDYGYAVRVEGVEKPLLLNQRILSLNPNFMDEYIFYYLQSSVFRDVFFSFETGGVNQGNVGSKAVESILIPIPPLEEAKEIEKMLNNLLKNEKETLKILNVEDKLETLKQATLSKAFRGELGTNDPREENAIELLKEVLQEQVK
ncbi:MULTISPECIES: restriction endonuclease subunit S [Bacillus]|uniref:Restriction endonuclease subunit S n=1 Tax=Bacillus velezensis TaxID=492670 RepID=A0ABC8DBX0_BACVE|nr:MULTISPECIES: restriction endonuclease subunit S [Bacillus]AMQ71335.1 hypothetical protein BAMY6639_04485 [Bacillus amyloliquefaciens UMAF6639]AMR51238.1 restriction endonuclease subunit S [Bacillus amyloliquefaciens]ANB48696.1 restriction endonuclease subunit S [Bacillus velezensis]AQP97435.1 restriction endonuclease subunit S [Bacillus sp. 275]AVI29563.1 restriction endonuclease subunit S [Bacillus velezensis]